MILKYPFNVLSRNISLNTKPYLTDKGRLV